jgi:hypothetical protein
MREGIYLILYLKISTFADETTTVMEEFTTPAGLSEIKALTNKRNQLFRSKVD